MSTRKGLKLKKAAVMKMGTAAGLTTEELYRELLSRLVEDATRDGLAETPERVEKAMAFLTQGYAMDVRTVLNGALFEVIFSRSCCLSGVKMRMPRRPREMVTYHCCAFVAGLTVESENRT